MRKKTRGEEGLVAIIVATVVMIVMSLITLGFARLMQKEQRQALDKSLSTQAFYAAESGVNDVVQALQDPDTPYTGSKPDCDVSASNGTPFTNGTISSLLASSYSCLIINPTPSTLVYSPGRITTAISTTIPVNAADTSQPITEIKVAWDPYPGVVGSPVLSTTACTATTTPLPASTAWNPNTPGVLRLDLVPANVLNRDSLANGALALYLYPSNCPSPSTTITYGTTATGTIAFVKCDGTGARLCEATINTSAAPGAKNKYFVRLRSIYHDSSVTIRAFNGATQLNMIGAQTAVDSTGKVNDVIRRIQVRVPNSKTYPIPDFVLHSMDSVCKQLQIGQPNIADGFSSGPGSSSAGDCKL